MLRGEESKILNVYIADVTRNMVTVGHRDFLDINVPGFSLKF